MKIEKLVVGVLQANCYVVTIENKTIIIDPGDEAEKIINFCKDKNVIEILVTHNHFDHVGALKKVEKEYNLKANNKSGMIDYKVINTPGHTSDSKSFYFPAYSTLFTGDFIFNNAIGRTDLETGNDLNMKASLKMISEYPDDTKIYPGHGISSTLKEEKQWFNRYYN